MITTADFPAPFLEKRTCSRCGAAFMAETRRFLCLQCRKPKTRVRTEHVNELTFRDKQIADLTSQGMQAKEIAWELKLTTGTIRLYMSRIYRTIGVRNRSGLAAYWVRQQMASALKETP